MLDRFSDIADGKYLGVGSARASKNFESLQNSPVAGSKKLKAEWKRQQEEDQIKGQNAKLLRKIADP